MQLSQSASGCVSASGSGWLGSRRVWVNLCSFQQGGACSNFHIYEWPFSIYFCQCLELAGLFPPKRWRGTLLRFTREKEQRAGFPSVLVLENVRTCFCTVALAANAANVFYGSKLHHMCVHMSVFVWGGAKWCDRAGEKQQWENLPQKYSILHFTFKFQCSHA